MTFKQNFMYQILSEIKCLVGYFALQLETGTQRKRMLLANASVESLGGENMDWLLSIC